MIDYEVLSLLIHNYSLVTTKNANIAFFSCPLPGVKNGTSRNMWISVNFGPI